MRRNKRWRVVAGIVCFVLAASITAMPAAALTPSYTPSAAYRSSTYYENLKALPVTGDAAFDAVAIAMTQIAYHEGNSTAQFGGGGTGSGNFTEYNYAYGKVGGSYGYAWCAAFVSWCLTEAGARESAGGLFASCTLWVEKLQSLGQYRTRASGYTPKAGDLIFFRSAGVSRASDHVGLVRYVKGGRVYTVEGNASNQVSLRDYALKDTYIVGYGLPAYTGHTVRVDRLTAEDRATGYYAVSYTFVNVRADRSASATKRGTLQKGALVKVTEIKNGWGRIEYNGKEGYISLEYADFVTPLSYTVRYVSEGKTLHEVKHYSTATLAVSTLIPEREGHRFLYWTDAQGKVYRAAQALPAGDRVLNAFFEKLPEPEPEAAPPVFAPPDDAGEAGNASTDAVFPPQFDADAGEMTVPEPTVTPRLAAARHAGVVSAILALVLGGMWYGLRRREEE